MFHNQLSTFHAAKTLVILYNYISVFVRVGWIIFSDLYKLNLHQQEVCHLEVNKYIKIYSLRCMYFNYSMPIRCSILLDISDPSHLVPRANY